MKHRWVSVLLAGTLLAMLPLWLGRQMIGEINGLLWLAADVWLWTFVVPGSLLLLILYVLSGMFAANLRLTVFERVCLLAGLPLLTLGACLINGMWPTQSDLVVLLITLLAAGSGLLSGAWLSGKLQRQPG